MSKLRCAFAAEFFYHDKIANLITFTSIELSNCFFFSDPCTIEIKTTFYMVLHCTGVIVREIQLMLMI